jgi:hypothetical protein
VDIADHDGELVHTQGPTRTLLCTTMPITVRLLQFGSTTQWIAHMDVDEFFVPTKTDSLVPIIKVSICSLVLKCSLVFIIKVMGPHTLALRYAHTLSH